MAETRATSEIVITGASRGIGRALALAVASAPSTSRRRLWVLGRDEGRLQQTADVAQAAYSGCEAVVLPVDFTDLEAVDVVAERLRRSFMEAGASEVILIHNAGLWPAKRVLGASGLEAAFVTNVLAPLRLQAPLLAAGVVNRVMVVSAGLLVKGRFDERRTPTGDDFSAIGTYCTTKLAQAVAMREVLRRHVDVDAIILHPGVVRTDLGSRRGPLGALLKLVKRSWETPETCAARLMRVLEVPRWRIANSTSWAEPKRLNHQDYSAAQGPNSSVVADIPWWVEETPSPWPSVCEAPETVAAVTRAVKRCDVGGDQLPSTMPSS